MAQERDAKWTRRVFHPYLQTIFFGGLSHTCHTWEIFAIHAIYMPYMPPPHTHWLYTIGHLCHAHGPNIAPTNSDSPTLQSFLTLIIWSSQVPKSRQSMARRWWQWEGCRDLRRKGHRPNASIPGGTGRCPGDPSYPGIIVGRTCWVFASIWTVTIHWWMGQPKAPYKFITRRAGYRISILLLEMQCQCQCCKGKTPLLFSAAWETCNHQSVNKMSISIPTGRIQSNSNNL